MKLYVNGDSHCCGIELSHPSLGWPDLLSKHIDTTLINHAMPGISNSSILRSTKEFLQKNSDLQDVFVILGTTSWEREEWEHDGKLYNVSAGAGTDTWPAELQNRFKDWVVTQTDTVRAYKSNQTHQEFYDLHVQLTKNGIGHVFFHTMNPFMDGADFKTLDKFDWGSAFIDPYISDSCYFWYLKNQGFEPTAGFHHMESAQQHWAKFMLQYLQGHNLI